MAPYEYKYTKLKDLQVGDRYNVYGIITEILKEKGLTSKGKLHSICRVKDESLPANSSFKMHFFIPSHHRLDGLMPGNILRLHRLKVEEYQGAIDGRVLSGTDVVTFSSIPQDITYHSEAKTITLTDDDKKRLEELREMIQLEKIFADESSILTVTESQRIVFKGYEQHKSPSKQNGNKNKSDGEDVDDPEEEDTDPNLKRGQTTRLLNPACKIPKLVANPLHNSFQSRKRKSYELNQNQSDQNQPQVINEPSSSSKKVVGVESTVNSKKPFSLEHGRQSSSRVKRQSELVPKSVTSNDCHSGQEPSIDCQLSSMFGQPAQNSKQSPNTKTNTACGKGNKAQITEANDCLSDQEPSIECQLSAMFGEPAQNSKQSPNQTNTAYSKGNKAQITEASTSMKNIANEKDKDVALSEEECPGLSCGGKDCFLEGLVLLKDDDPRLANFNENDLVCEGLGDIPAADEDGDTFTVEGVMPFGDGSRAKEITVSDLLQFQWPRHRCKVKIVKIKPSIKCLNTNGPRNLLSGVCLQCGRYSFYSQLKWQKVPALGTKKPLCPFCKKDEKVSTVYLEFRIKLTVQDSWGTSLDVHAVKNHASNFLGCSTKQYQEEERSRKRVVDLLSNALYSKSIFTITLFRMQTVTKPMFYVCETKLSEVLSEAERMRV
ncbi:uncharacterized protein LOC113212333 isoform X1 [Frankliniella occidentalis]|uniref:Uncharacterized protein LOC113212333 isoform X1 n=1 Tax=Frankliniella occidentalis TaxID=133901 RepID=A0A6J1SZS0_FRAOC|nr:uncharacterized protein LOC113212333 isoform X1 [Frankliniella occidentalis]